MTRVNVGIEPEELCDQHLLAEYRELPRCFGTRDNAKLKGFRLGTGHQLWCAQFQRSLAFRQTRLCEEMLFRGFTVNYMATGRDLPPDGRAWTKADEQAARPLLIERIIERLAEMKRTPTWTKRKRPEWAKEAA